MFFRTNQTHSYTFLPIPAKKSALFLPSKGCHIPKKFDKRPTDVPFRRSQVGLRRAETAFQNSEAPLLFDRIRDPMKISGLQNRQNIPKIFDIFVLWTTSATRLWRDDRPALRRPESEKFQGTKEKILIKIWLVCEQVRIFATQSRYTYIYITNAREETVNYNNGKLLKSKEKGQKQYNNKSQGMSLCADTPSGN